MSEQQAVEAERSARAYRTVKLERRAADHQAGLHRASPSSGCPVCDPDLALTRSQRSERFFALCQVRADVREMFAVGGPSRRPVTTAGAKR